MLHQCDSDHRGASMATSLGHTARAPRARAAQAVRLTRACLDGRAILFALLLALAAAGPAWAVAVELTVTGPGGDPVAGATVDLGLGIPPVTTDGEGRATVEVDEELVDGETETEAVVTFPLDPSTGERRQQRVPVTLTPRLVIPVTLPGTGSAPRRPVQSDLPTLGCFTNGGKFLVQIGAGAAEFEKAPLERQFLERVFRADGMVLERTAGPRDAAEIAEINRTEKKNHDLDTEGAVSLRIPLRPGVCNRGGRGIVPVPSLSLGAQRVDATFESLPVGMPQLNQSFRGEGNAWSGGLDLALLRGGSRHYVVIGGEYGEGDNDAVRTVDFAGTFLPPGAVTVSDRATYEHERIAARLLYGYSFDRVNVQLGLQHTWFDAELGIFATADVSALFPSAPTGTQVLLEDVAVNLFSDEYVQAVAAVIASLGGPAVVQGEARFGDDAASYRFGVGFRF